MMLRTELQDLDDASPALLGEGRMIDTGDLKYPPTALIEPATGRCVGVYLADPVKLACALVWLDGTAARLILISHDTAPELAARLFARAGGELLVTDDPDGATHVDGAMLDWGAAQPMDSAREDWPVPTGVIATEWVLATSGTTSEPKLVCHSLDSLTRTTSRNRDVGRRHRWGEMYEICRFAGLQVYLQALLSGSALILPDLGQPIEAQVAMLADHSCTALSATPTMWRKILMTSAVERLALAQVTLGGEIADAAILNALASRFPRARIVHIYASTEAGAAFAVTDGRPGFPAAYLEQPPKGIHLKVVDDQLYIQNTRVASRYLGDAKAFADDEGYVATGDLVTRAGDRFLFLGRASGSINVGGNKVMPEEIERVLLDHPAVHLARVSGKANPIIGQLVVADVVLGADGAAGWSDPAKALKQHCAARLERWKVPAMIRIVPHLEIGSGGKVDRIQP